MDKPLLNNPDTFPDDEVLSQVLKTCKNEWDLFMKALSENYSSLTLHWKYYNDGKAWLCKIALKKKTICWLSVWDGFFKLGFYFTEKDSSQISALEISDALKEQFINNKSIGKLKPLTLDVKEPLILESLYHLMDYKIGVKK